MEVVFLGIASGVAQIKADTCYEVVNWRGAFAMNLKTVHNAGSHAAGMRGDSSDVWRTVKASDIQ